MTAKVKPTKRVCGSPSLIREDEKNDATKEIPSCVDDQQKAAIKDQVRVALKALKAHLSKTASKSLFPEIDQAVQLGITYKKPPMVNVDGLKKRITLPHSGRTLKNTTVCLIMPDLDRSVAARTDADVDKQAREWAAKIEDDHAIKLGTHINKILTKRQLEREYHTYKQKRDLASAYDIFMVDGRVLKSVKSFLGKEFIKAQKNLYDFDYNKPLLLALERTLKTTIFSTKAFASQVRVYCGHFGLPLSDLALNVDEVIDKVAQYCPGGFINIRALYIQPRTSTPSLCVFQDNGSANEVKLETRKKFKRRDHEVEGELTTLPDGLKVAVLPSGQTRVLREDDGLPVLFPTVNDEWEEADDMKPVLNPDKIAKKKLKRKLVAQKKLRKKAKVEKEKSLNVSSMAGILCPTNPNDDTKQEVKDEKTEVKEEDEEAKGLSPPPSKKAKKIVVEKRKPVKKSTKKTKG